MRLTGGTEVVEPTPSDRQRDFTLNNITTAQTNGLIFTGTEPVSVESNNSAPEVFPLALARVTFEFRPNGDWRVDDAFVDFNGSAVTSNFSVGSWATAPASPGDFTIEVTNIQAFQPVNAAQTQPVNFAPYFTGSYQTPLSLSTQRDFTLELQTSQSGAAESDSLRFEVDFELTDPNGVTYSNSITVTLFVEISDLLVGN